MITKTQAKKALADLLALCRDGQSWPAPFRTVFDFISAAPPPTPEDTQRYTCIGKGGEYEVAGHARAAGILKGMVDGDSLVVYRDTETGHLYVRTKDDFDLRMSAAMPATSDEQVRQS